MALIREPPLADIRRPEIFSPRPVRVNVPNDHPAACQEHGHGKHILAALIPL